MEKNYEKLEKVSNLIHQDWKQVVLNKSHTNKSDTNKTGIKKISQEKQKDIKLHKQVEEDNLKHKKITQELRTIIIQTRASQKLKQKDLAQRCNLPVQVINEIESGKAIYNHQHINTIKRVLKL